MFQQRHLEAIAAMMQSIKPVEIAQPFACAQWNQTRAAMSRMFKQSNPRFDVARFERACEPGANVRKRRA